MPPDVSDDLPAARSDTTAVFAPSGNADAPVAPVLQSPEAAQKSRGEMAGSLPLSATPDRPNPVLQNIPPTAEKGTVPPEMPDNPELPEWQAQHGQEKRGPEINRPENRSPEISGRAPELAIQNTAKPIEQPTGPQGPAIHLPQPPLFAGLVPDSAWPMSSHAVPRDFVPAKTGGPAVAALPAFTPQNPGQTPGPALPATLKTGPLRPVPLDMPAQAPGPVMALPDQPASDLVPMVASVHALAAGQAAGRGQQPPIPQVAAPPAATPALRTLADRQAKPREGQSADGPAVQMRALEPLPALSPQHAAPLKHVPAAAFAARPPDLPAPARDQGPVPAVLRETPQAGEPSGEGGHRGVAAPTPEADAAPAALAAPFSNTQRSAETAGPADPAVADVSALPQVAATRVAIDTPHIQADSKPANPAVSPAHLAAQVTQAVARADTGGMIEMTLQPEELGKVQITLAAQDDQLTLSIVAERPEILDLMRRNGDLLQQELRQMGMAKFSLDFAGQHPQRHQQEAMGGTPAQHVTPEEPALPETSPQRHLGPGRVDIRV